jgi:hypothetical protein
MKDLLRTLVAAVVGAVVAIAVVVGQPALAGQVDKSAAKNSVTSKSIKNATIKTKDLSSEVSGPLAKAGTALQSVPDNSVTTTKLASNAVTGAKVVDNSLRISDIALASGVQGVDFMTLALNNCQATTGIETGHVVTGDLILVSQPTGVSGAIQITAREDATSTTAIDIVACDVGTATFNPPPTDYRWVVIGS